MRSNKTYPQRSFDANSLGSSVMLMSRQEEGCCEEWASCRCCSRRCACISAAVLLGLAVIAAAVASAIVLGIPPRPPVNRYCTTAQNRSGFLCDDRVTCIPASDLCNGVKNCPSGADENPQMCADLPNNLPGNLIFRCGNPQFWIFIDKKCNYINDCGDCSDEIGAYADCPPCGPGWWSCVPVVFMYCACVPRCLCRDGQQHCSNWSDEYSCANKSCQ